MIFGNSEDNDLAAQKKQYSRLETIPSFLIYLYSAIWLFMYFHPERLLYRVAPPLIHNNGSCML